MSDETAIAAAWAAMRASPMNSWVGGGDPQAVGEENLCAARALLGALPDGEPLLDYGCGVGRTTLPLALACPDGVVLGIDIVPALIGFCRSVVMPAAANTSFQALHGSHPLYRQLAGSRWYDSRIIPVEPDRFAQAHESWFAACLMFSVLTHATPRMAHDILRLLATVLRPGGRAVVSCLLDRNPSADWKDLEATMLNRVSWGLQPLIGMLRTAGLRIESVVPGRWSGASAALHPHDLLLLERPL